MDALLSIAIGVLSSLIASFIFLLNIRLIKPKIDISPNITKFFTDKGKEVYSIKIINRSRQPAINVRAQFHYIYESQLSGGPLTTAKDLKLKRDEVFQIHKYKKIKDPKKEEANFAYRFLCYDDIESLISDESRDYKIRITILAYNSFSGLGKVFIKVYDKTEIIPGRFKQGDNFLTIKDKNS